MYVTLDIGSYMKENYSYVEEPDKKTVQITLADGIAAGQTKTVFYEVKVSDLKEGETEKNISNTITTKINDKIYRQETKNNVIKKAEMEVYIRSYIERGENDRFSYFLDIKNLTDKQINDVRVETNRLQKEFKLYGQVTLFGEDSTDSEGKLIPIGNINEENKYVANIDSIGPQKTRTILIVMDATNFDKGIMECPLSMVAHVSSENTDTYTSNENRRTAYPIAVTAIQELDKEGQEVNSGETVQYKFTIENRSKIRAVVMVKDTFSELLEDVNVKYDGYSIEGWYYTDPDNPDTINNPLYVSPSTTWYDLEKEENLKYELIPEEDNLSDNVELNKLNIPMVIPAGKTLEITVTGVAAEVFETTDVENYLVVTGQDMEKYTVPTVSTNISKFTIVRGEKKDTDDDPDDDFTYTKDPDLGKDDLEDPNNPDNPYNPDDSNNSDIKNGYNINGIVWIDKNKDGIKQPDEDVLEGVPVKLYNADTNSIVVSTNNNKQITNTNSDGKYEFNNISNGNYLVLFEYDTEKYEITKYFEYGKNASTSNAMKKQVAIDGVEKTVGVTDIIKINNENIENINIGLIANRTFDLKLDKYISKVTVKNDKTKTYEYKNKQLAKVEIAAKQIEKTQVEIEYKIIVTNEGNTSAYVDEIVDYLPQDLQFAAISNKGWIRHSKGNLVNTSLSGEKINAGESKELTLIVTKKMTAQNTGTVLNAAEINASKSSENLKDIDSIAGNNDKKEDDYSEASIIISIKTGLVRNIIIFIVGLAVVALAVILFKKLKNKKVITFVALLIMIISVSDAVSAINISGGATASGSDGNTWYCRSPGKGQCHGGTHEYAETKTWDTWEYSHVTNIKDYKIKVNKKATDVSTTDGSIKKAGYSITISGKDNKTKKDATF